MNYVHNKTRCLSYPHEPQIQMVVGTNDQRKTCMIPSIYAGGRRRNNQVASGPESMKQEFSGMQEAN